MNNQGQVSESLGSTLRSLRQQHGLTLQDMAEKTGLSAGFLSKIERGASQPTINNLQKICYVLHITINDLAVPNLGRTAEQEEMSVKSPVLITPDQRSLIYNLNDVIKLESIFSSSSNYKLDAMTLTGGSAEYVSSKHRYDEIGVVAQGAMEIQLGNGQVFVLNEGGALLIPSGTEHKVRKLSEGVCTSFWLKLIEGEDDSGL